MSATDAPKTRTRKVSPITNGNRTTHFMFGLGGELLGGLAIPPDGSRTFTDYYWLNSLPVARHVRVPNTTGTQVSDTRTYLHPDHLGTPRLVTNATRQVIWRLDTDPFSDGTVSEDPDRNSVLEVMPLRFPGQYFDTEAGVAYNYFRDYDQGTGRYTHSDPIGLGGGNNRFGYAYQNPIQLTDPSGLEGVGPWTFAPGYQRDHYEAAMKIDPMEVSVGVAGCIGTVCISYDSKDSQARVSVPFPPDPGGSVSMCLTPKPSQSSCTIDDVNRKSDPLTYNYGVGRNLGISLPPEGGLCVNVGTGVASPAEVEADAGPFPW